MKRLESLKYLISTARDFNKNEEARMKHIYDICIERNIPMKNMYDEKRYMEELNGCLDKDESPFDSLFVILGYSCQNGKLKITKENGDTLISSKHLILSLPEFINNVDKCYITDDDVVISFTSLLNLGIHYDDIPFN